MFGKELYMKVSNEQIKLCQSLFKKHFNITLTDQEAIAKMIDLIKMVQLVYEPLMEDKKWI